MNYRRSVLLLAALILVYLGIPAAGVSQEPQSVPRPLSELGLGVFKAVSELSPEPNVVLSPISVGLAVALLAEGAEDQTLVEMRAALGLGADEWEAFAQGIGHFLVDVASDTSVVSRMASSLWVDEDKELAAHFRSRAEREHRALVAEVDLQADETRELVNAWASDQTEGRITSAMPQARPDMTILLLNAVYFKGLWRQPFDTARTQAQPFKRMGGDTVSVPTMHRSGTYDRFETDYATGVRMPYRGERFASYVVLPADSLSVDMLVERLSVAEVETWSEGARSAYMALWIPRFTHRGTWDLREPLRRAGIERALSVARSQLNGLWARPRSEETTYVTDASQSTFIQFDEEGTEAAALTRMTIVSTGVVRSIEFRVDRPFLLVLRDERSGAILFVARIGDPGDEGG